MIMRPAVWMSISAVASGSPDASLPSYHNSTFHVPRSLNVNVSAPVPALLHVVAEPLLAQEHGRLDRLEFVDVAGVVHEQAFADNLGPVDDAVWNLALIHHAAHYTTYPIPMSRCPPAFGRICAIHRRAS